MKTNIIRAFVVVLALSGAAATHAMKSANHQVAVASSAVPTPMCPPSDPNACGLD